MFPVKVTASVHGVPYELGVIERPYIVSYKPDPRFISNINTVDALYFVCIA
jgi:hypothetical protein